MGYFIRLWVLCVTISYAWVGATQPSFASSLSPDEKVLVRFRVDSGESQLNGISARRFEQWSRAQNAVKAFRDRIGGSVNSVLARHVVPGSLGRAIAQNKAQDLDALPDDSDRYWIAPFGTARTRSKTSNQIKKALPTYRIATPEELSQVLSERAKQADFKVFVPDFNVPPNLLPSRNTIQMELTRAELEALHAADPNLRTETFNGRFPVVTEASQTVAPQPIKPEVQRVLYQLFEGRKTPQKKPLLIIIDDAWPTDDAFLATKNLIGSVFPSLWKANSDLSANIPELSAETKRLSSPGIPKGMECDSLNNCDIHAKRVEMSLASMTEYAMKTLGDSPVDIIYLPMTASQQGATDILRLLWNLAYAAGTDLAPNSPTFFDEERTRLRQEREFLASLQDELRGSEFISNWAILTGVFHFARRYSVVSEVPVYISLSWTTEDTTFNPPPLVPWNTLIVAAAGNHCENNACDQFADQLSPPRLFVERASSPIDVLLVLNVDEQGVPTCNSTRVRTSYSVVGFDGALDGDCGTSFAAPRVAWLLAARYALLGTAANWKYEQRDRLKWILTRPERRKCGGEGDFPCVHFPIADLLDTSTSAAPITP